MINMGTPRGTLYAVQLINLGLQIDYMGVEQIDMSARQLRENTHSLHSDISPGFRCTAPGLRNLARIKR